MDLKENLPSEITSQNLILSLVGLFLISTGIFLGSNLNYFSIDGQSISEDHAAQDLVSLLETRSGQEYEVVSVKTENDLYKIDVSDQQNQLSTYYITKNGEMMTNEMTEFEQLKNTVEAQRGFSNCLANKNTVMYGNSSQRATSLQIQVLGGVNMVAPIYKDLNNQQNLQEAVDRGVETAPGIYYDGSVLSGVNQISQISELTGCQYSEIE